MSQESIKEPPESVVAKKKVEPLKVGADMLHVAAQRARESRTNGVLGDVKAALQPWINEAAKLRGELEELEAKHGKGLDALGATPWHELRVYDLDRDVGSLYSLWYQASTLLRSGLKNLADVPRQVRALTPGDLVGYRDVDGYRGAVDRIREVVKWHREAPAAIRALIPRIDDLLERLARRIPADAPVAKLKFISLDRRPIIERPVRQTRADNAPKEL